MSAFISKKSTGALNKAISNTTLQIKATYHYNPLKSRLEQIFKIRELYFIITIDRNIMDIFITLAQTLSSFRSINLSWTPQFLAVLHVASTANLNLQMASPECLFHLSFSSTRSIARRACKIHIKIKLFTNACVID